jgi:2-dehydropantoate 2-reductase
MRILCLGAGAIGGYFGGRLLQAGYDVTFLVRPRRQAQLLANGLVLESPAFGDYVASRVSALTDDQIRDAPRFDYILLTCKAYDLDDAIRAIAPCVDAGGVVVPLLNGLAHLDRLNHDFGSSRILGGMAKIAATLAPDGTIRHLNTWRYITFGEQDGTMSDRVAALKAAFDRTSVDATTTDAVVALMWAKFVHLATVASMTCLMRASVGEIARAPRGTRTLLEIFEAMAAIAARAGYPVSDGFKAEYYRLFQDRTSPYTASMLRDLEAGGRVEADHIVGYAVAKAMEFGIEAPLLEASYLHLKAYEQRRAAGRA